MICWRMNDGERTLAQRTLRSETKTRLRAKLLVLKVAFIIAFAFPVVDLAVFRRVGFLVIR